MNTHDKLDLTPWGAYAATLCAGTYVVGFFMLLMVLGPMGYGSLDIDRDAVVAFAAENRGVMLLWNNTIYVLNALALVVLVITLGFKLLPIAPRAAVLSLAFGLIWATLVLGAGMVANMAVEQALAVYGSSPDEAALTWQMLHNVELGLGGGNEIAGGVWILCVSLAALKSSTLSRLVVCLGWVVGLSGLLTIIPTTGAVLGVVFGLGAIAWFAGVAISLFQSKSPRENI